MLQQKNGMEIILKIKSDYVRQNPDKDVSVYVMSQLSRDQLGMLLMF